MHKTGEKFIIEIDSVMTNKKGGLYGIKGFNILVFDENGLDRLTSYGEEFDNGAEVIADAEKYGYGKGLSDGWECAKKISLSKVNGGIGIDNVREIFDTADTGEILKSLTPQEAIEKLKAWEEKQEIKEGDYIISNNGTMAVVQRVDSWGRWECLTKTGQTLIKDDQKQYWRKTGKHIDLTEIFKGLEGENADSD